MKHFQLHLSSALLIVILLSCNPEARLMDQLKWDSSSNIPPSKDQDTQSGLAGALIGISNDHLIVAGGANFPDDLPWKGGQKVYSNHIYVAEKDQNNELQWLQTTDTLLKPIAYVANVPYQNGFISVGGEDNEGPVASVSYWNWNNEETKLLKEDLPDLPYPLTNASAAILNNQLFIIGGENKQEVFSNIWYLDLNNQKEGWLKGPQLPRPTSHSVAVIQSNSAGNHLYVIGGRAKQVNGISQLYNQTLKLDLIANTWIEKSKIGDGETTLSALSAATAVSKGDYIFVMGGGNGKIFHQIETFAKKAKEASSQQERDNYLSQQYKLAENHPGFSKDVFRYNTVKDKWTKIDPLPYGPVTTTAIIWDNEILIPSGEIHPGIRTPKILRTELPNEN